MIIFIFPGANGMVMNVPLTKPCAHAVALYIQLHTYLL